MIQQHFYYKKTWLGLLVLYTLTLFITGVTPSTPKMPDQLIPHFDKILHFLVYFGLGYLFHQLLDRSPKVLLIRAIVIGLIIELIQTQVPNRGFETADLLANTLGAFSGIVISARLTPQLLLKIDKAFQS